MFPFPSKSNEDQGSCKIPDLTRPIHLLSLRVLYKQERAEREEREDKDSLATHRLYYYGDWKKVKGEWVYPSLEEKIRESLPKGAVVFCVRFTRSGDSYEVFVHRGVVLIYYQDGTAPSN